MSRCANEEFGCCQSPSPSRQAYRRHYAVLELNHIIRDIEVNNEIFVTGSAQGRIEQKVVKTRPPSGSVLHCW